MAAKHGLGKGLKALMKEVPALDSSDEGQGGAQTMSLAQIVRSPLQPRQEFAGEEMAELARSIGERGVVQPLLVRKKGRKYELIAGERRFRAAGEVGLTTVPVIVMKANDQEALELALIENLVREDLNPIEEAQGYRVLADTYRMTQDKIAERVGKARASVANAMRLLELPKEVIGLLAQGKLSVGHAKVLLGVSMSKERVLLAKEAVRLGISVRDLEKTVAKRTRAPRKVRAKRDDIPGHHVAHLSEVMQRHLGTSVRITSCKTLANGKKAKGRVEIDYFSSEDLDRLIEVLGISLDEA